MMGNAQAKSVTIDAEVFEQMQRLMAGVKLSDNGKTGPSAKYFVHVTELTADGTIQRRLVFTHQCRGDARGVMEYLQRNGYAREAAIKNCKVEILEAMG